MNGGKKLCSCYSEGNRPFANIVKRWENSKTAAFTKSKYFQRKSGTLTTSWTSRAIGSVDKLQLTLLGNYRLQWRRSGKTPL